MGVDTAALQALGYISIQPSLVVSQATEIDHHASTIAAAARSLGTHPLGTIEGFGTAGPALANLCSAAGRTLGNCSTDIHTTAESIASFVDAVETQDAVAIAAEGAQR